MSDDCYPVELPQEIASLIDTHFLSVFQQCLQELDPKADFSISEWWTIRSGTYFWTDAFDKAVEKTGYYPLGDFWKNGKNAYEIDCYFDYICDQAEKLGITQSDPHFYEIHV